MSLRIGGCRGGRRLIIILFERNTDIAFEDLYQVCYFVFWDNIHDDV